MIYLVELWTGESWVSSGYSYSKEEHAKAMVDKLRVTKSIKARIRAFDPTAES